jgi:hypothetical protein
VADVAEGTGLRIWHDVLAALARQAASRHWDLMHFALLNWLARNGDLDVEKRFVIP